MKPLRNMSRVNTIETLKSGGTVTYHLIYSVYRVYDQSGSCIGSLLYTTFHRLLRDGVLKKLRYNNCMMDQYQIAEEVQ